MEPLVRSLALFMRASFAANKRVAILECDTADFADLIRRFRDNLTQGADAMVPPSAAHLAIAAAAVAQKVLSDYFRFLKMPCPQACAQKYKPQTSVGNPLVIHKFTDQG